MTRAKAMTEPIAPIEHGEIRRLAGRLAIAAWAAHDLLHDPLLTSERGTTAMLVTLRRWTISTLRDAKRLGRLMNANPVPPSRRPLSPSREPAPPPRAPLNLRVLKGGRA